MLASIDRATKLGCRHKFNPLMGTLKPQSNGPLYSNTMIGTLAVDGWAVNMVQRRGVLCRPHCTKQTTRQWPVYQLHIIQCGGIITCAY